MLLTNIEVEMHLFSLNIYTYDKSDLCSSFKGTQRRYTPDMKHLDTKCSNEFYKS